MVKIYAKGQDAIEVRKHTYSLTPEKRCHISDEILEKDIDNAEKQYSVLKTLKIVLIYQLRVQNINQLQNMVNIYIM